MTGTGPDAAAAAQRAAAAAQPDVATRPDVAAAAQPGLVSAARPGTAAATPGAGVAALPTFVSLALRDLPRPDYCDVRVVPLPVGAPTDPAGWARAVFDARHGPRWVLALLALRQVAVRMIGVPPAPRDTFAVDDVQGEEALIVADDRHLDFRVGVGVDAERRLLRVVTAVRLHGWRGRVYFGPVRLAHPVVTDAMIRSAVRRVGRWAGTSEARR